MSATRRRWAAAPVLLAAYVAIVVWLTWPLTRHVATHLPNTHPACRFDTLLMGWVLAYETHALVTDPTHFADANIYHPERRALFYGMPAFGALPYFAGPYLLTGNPTLALNLMFLLGVALTAWTLHLTIAEWRGSHLAGVVAAWTFLTARWVLWEWIPTSPGFAILHYFPMIVFGAARQNPRLAGTALLTVLIVLQCLTEMVYVAPAVLAPLAILAALRLPRRATRRAGLHLLAALAVAVLVLVPLYAGFLAVRAENPDFARQTHWVGPHPRTHLPWGLLERGATAIQPIVGALIAAGIVSILLGGSRATRTATRAAWTHAALWTAVGTVLSLSPTAVWGTSTFQTPTYWLGRLVPAYQTIRLPGRLGVAALIGLALAAGLAAAECARRLSRASGSRIARRWSQLVIATVVVALMYVQYDRGFSTPFRRAALPSAYPLATPPTSQSRLVDILRVPGGPLLELPVSLAPAKLGGGFPQFHVQAQYRSTFHWRPLLNGYHSYWPRGFPERMALAERLPDPAALDALRRETGLAMILVHLKLLVHAEQRSRWMAVAENGAPGLTLQAREGDDLLFSLP